MRARQLILRLTIYYLIILGVVFAAMYLWPGIRGYLPNNIYLGDANHVGKSGFLGKAQQGFGDPGLQIEKRQVLDLLVGPPQALAQDHQQPDAKLRPAFDQFEKRPARHHQQLAIGVRDRVGGALLAVD